MLRACIQVDGRGRSNEAKNLFLRQRGLISWLTGTCLNGLANLTNIFQLCAFLRRFICLNCIFCIGVACFLEDEVLPGLLTLLLNEHALFVGRTLASCLLLLLSCTLSLASSDLFSLLLYIPCYWVMFLLLLCMDAFLVSTLSHTQFLGRSELWCLFGHWLFAFSSLTA